MPWYLVLVVSLSSFSLGFALCNQLYSKKVEALTNNLPSEVNLSDLRHEHFMKGWNAANSDVENVKKQYDKLVSPLKYAPEED